MERGAIRLRYKCTYCWWKKAVVYADWATARYNRVYCDGCLTREMVCVTPESEELIESLYE